ncbi:MAG: hypothetical protein AB8G86_03330 [Saprospiraceae bacterium]
MKYMKDLKEIIKPVVVLAIAFLMTVVVVGIIAYTNCEEAKLFIDNIMGNTVATSTLRQA